MADQVVLNRETARRIAKAVRAHELESEPSGRRGRGPRLQRPCKVAKITTAVTAYETDGTGVYGKGTALLLVLSKDPTTGKVTEVASTITVDVYHRGAAGIAVGRVVQLKVIDEFFVVDVDYC